MSLPQVVSREEWLVARKELLAKEKQLTRALDALNADRRRLPMVDITKRYVFEGPDGEVSLLDMFEGRRQLIVDHFMFDPSWDKGCASCSGRVQRSRELLLLGQQLLASDQPLLARHDLGKAHACSFLNGSLHRGG